MTDQQARLKKAVIDRFLAGDSVAMLVPEYEGSTSVNSVIRERMVELEEMVKLTITALTKRRGQNLLVLAFAELHGLTDELIEFLSKEQDNG